MKVLILISLLISTSIFSQEKTRVIVISNNGEKTKVEVDNRHKKLNPKTSKTYYWLKSKKVISTQGAYQGSLLHGIYEENYKNHQLKSQGVFKYGLKTKTWKYWNEQGVLQKTDTWKNGVLIETTNYKNGKSELSVLEKDKKRGLKLKLRKDKNKENKTSIKEKKSAKTKETDKGTKKAEEIVPKKTITKEATP